MRRLQYAIIFVAVLELSIPLSMAADEGMVERLQGKWSQSLSGPEGESLRVVKHFDGQNEIYAVFRDGEQVYAHVAKNYRIQLINEREQLYAYSVNGFEVTVGPNRGQKLEQLIEYLFCIKGGQFIEMGGILTNDPRQPSVSVYSCVDNDPANISNGQLMDLALEKLRSKEYEAAIRLFTQLAERAPTATHYALLGDCYRKQRQLERADVHYRQALAVDPQHCGANHALGRDAVLLKRYRDAIPYLDAANDACVGTVLHAQNLRFRVEAFLGLDRVADADSDMKRLSDEYPENRNTYEAGILIARRIGDQSLLNDYQAKLKAIDGGDFE